MKKFTAIALVIILALTLLAACDGGISSKNNGMSIISGLLEDLSNAIDSSPSASDSGGTSSSDGSAPQNSSSKTDDEFEYGNGKDFIAKNLTGDYSITYRVYANGSDETAEIFVVRTSEGYYIGTFASEALYIKNKDNLYETYFKSDEGFYKVDFLDPITEKEVQSNMAVILDFMTQYSGSSGLKKDGTETVADRNCDRYKASASGFGLAVGISYCIDKKTGVCMKFRYDMAGDEGMANMTFECTEFLTSGVKLPVYK